MKNLKKILLSTILSSIFIITSINAEINNKYLQETSKAFTSIGKKAIPACVFIKSEFNSKGNGLNQEDHENPFDFFNDEFFRHFFGGPKGQPPQKPQPQTGGGSGFIISKTGHIITNNHVIKDADKITVVMNNGDEYEAKIIGNDPKTDLAVLKIDTKKDLPFLAFGDSDKLDIGEWVIAIGNPFALQASLTVGVVSAKGRQNLRITDLEDFIQTDAAINPGNSGGPLLNIYGKVIGINTAIVSRSGGYMGIGFAIPSILAKHVVDQIIKTGSVTRGYLGVVIQPVDKEIAEAFNLEKTQGILIADVTKDSPAEKGGLIQGDIVIEYNNKPLAQMSSFRNEVALMKPGTKLDLKVIRKGKEKKLTITLGSSKEEKKIIQASNTLGIDVTELKDISAEKLNKLGISDTSEGLIISNIKPGSLAQRAGLKPGMLILQINQNKVKTLKDFNDALKNIKNKKHLLLLIKHKKVTRFIAIRTK
jgi:serine protease Do